MRTLLVALLLQSSLVLPSFAQDANSPQRRSEFDSLVAANRRPLHLDGTRVSGPGLDWLLQQASRAAYVLLGEQHLTTEIIHVEDAILQGLARSGFTHLALEIGPWSTRMAEPLLRAGKLDSLLSRPDRGLSIPFLFERDFTRMVDGFVKAVPTRTPALMGLDQEFIGAGPLIEEMISAAARTPAERTAAAAFKDAIQKNAFLIGQSDGAALKALRDGFATSRDTITRRLIDELILSNEIYAPFTGRGGSVRDANDKRERYIKANFVAQHRAAVARGGTVKVAGVWGANHAIRGFSPTNILGFGNFLEEYGFARGETFFNVHLDCQGGSMRNPQTGQPGPCGSYFLSAAGALKDAVPADRVSLIDLRPLRAVIGRYPFLTERERGLILGFDVYVAVRDVTPATLYSAPPQR